MKTIHGGAVVNHNYDNYVDVELTGGLGNQLFQYSAGLFYANRSGKQLRLDLSFVNNGMTIHPSNTSILKLVQSTQFVIDHYSKYSVILKKIKDKLSSKSQLFSGLRRHLINEHQSTKLGFDEKLLIENKIERLQGYYQSWFFANELAKQNLYIKLNLSQKSAWLKLNEKKVTSKNQIALHVRGGDYKKVKNSIGMLSEEYYINAIHVMSNKVNNARYWVFSNEIDEAELRLAHILPKNTIWVKEPKDLDPVQTLFLMSKFKNLITANSSFSWWAAWIGNPKNQVIVPNPWFRRIKSPELLIPASWSSVDSYWMD
jgi:hypothetical protein